MRYVLVLTWFFDLAAAPGAGWGEEIAPGLEREGNLSVSAERLLDYAGLEFPYVSEIRWSSDSGAFKYTLADNTHMGASAWANFSVYDLARGDSWTLDCDVADCANAQWSSDGRFLSFQGMRDVGDEEVIGVVTRSGSVVYTLDQNRLNELIESTGGGPVASRRDATWTGLSPWHPWQPLFLMQVRSHYDDRAGHWLASTQGIVRYIDWLPDGSYGGWSPSGRRMAMELFRDGLALVLVGDFRLQRMLEPTAVGGFLGWHDEDRVILERSAAEDGDELVIWDLAKNEETVVPLGGDLWYWRSGRALVARGDRVPGTERSLVWVDPFSGTEKDLVDNVRESGGAYGRWIGKDPRGPTVSVASRSTGERETLQSGTSVEALAWSPDERKLLLATDLGLYLIEYP